MAASTDPNVPHVLTVNIRCQSEADAVAILNFFSAQLSFENSTGEFAQAEIETAGIVPASVYDADETDVTGAPV
jgi:hypothetical protein